MSRFALAPLLALALADTAPTAAPDRERALSGPAVQQMGNGETFDFEFTPREAGALRFLVTTGADVPLVSMPVRVRSR